MAEFIYSPDRFRRITPLRIVYLLLAIGAYLLTEAGRFVYRPWVYREGIADFGLADMVGNLGGTMVQIYLYLALANANRVQGWRIIGIVTAGYVAYEFAQKVLPKGTFDWLDVAATLVAGLCTAGVFVLLGRLFPEDLARAEGT